MSPARKPVRLHRLSIGAALLAIAAAPLALRRPGPRHHHRERMFGHPAGPGLRRGHRVPPVKQIRYNVVLACAPAGRSKCSRASSRTTCHRTRTTSPAPL